MFVQCIHCVAGCVWHCLPYFCCNIINSDLLTYTHWSGTCSTHSCVHYASLVTASKVNNVVKSTMCYQTRYKTRYTGCVYSVLCICHLSEETVKTLWCSTLLHKFCQAKMTAITWSKVVKGLLLLTILPVMSVGLWFMSTCTTDYVCYLWVKELPVMTPLVLSGFMVFLYLERCHCKMILKVIEVVFSSFLVNRNPTNKDEEKLFIVLGYEANLKDMCRLFIILVQASLLAFAQFWEKFLLETSNSCSADSNLYCFNITSDLISDTINSILNIKNINSILNTTHVWFSYQELNCSNTSQVEEAASIVCYKYAFNIGQAAASAIGIMSTNGLIIYTVCVVFLKMLHVDGAKSFTGKIILLVAKVIAVLEVLSFCAVLGGLQVTHISHVTGTIGKINSLFKTLSMGLMIAFSVYFFPVHSFKKTQNSTNNYNATSEPQQETSEPQHETEL